MIKIYLGIILFITTISNSFTQTVTDSIINQGVTRIFHYHIPSDYNGIDEIPMVVVLHGGNSNGMNFMDNSYFDEIGDTVSYISVFPTAYLGQWTDGRGNTQADSLGIDDIIFLSDMIDTLATEYSIDTCKLYLTGISNGGMMTHRFACEKPEKFQGYASIAASIPTYYYPNCSPNLPVNMMMIHGTEDNFSPYEGGTSGIPSSTGTVTGIDSTINFWNNNNSCINADSPDSIVYADINLMDNSYVVSYDYSPCTDNGEVKLYKVYGGGHTLPGGPGPIQIPIIGYSNKDINGAYEIWKFFSNKSCQTTTSLSEIENENEVSIYPNPSQNTITIKSDLNVEKVIVYDLLGKIVGIFNSSSINLMDFSSGVYLMEIEFLESSISTKRLIQKL